MTLVYFSFSQMKKIVYFAALLMMSVSGYSRDFKVKSPNGKIAVTFMLDERGAMQYKVDVNKSPFILPSDMGLMDKDFNLSEGFKYVTERKGSKDEQWTMPWGENKNHRNHYNWITVSMQNHQDVKLDVTFRVFDDGIGFRYEYDTKADSLMITTEKTEFTFADNGISWSIPASFETYELLYRTIELDKLDNANTPMTFKTDDGVYASVHEAALTDFPEMTLRSTGMRKFRTWLAPLPDGFKAKFDKGSFKTPWRTIQIADQAVGLINSSLILNLNEPCALEGDLSWIRPMKYVGIWWGMHVGIQSWVINDRHGATTENAKKYIDFAAANNIQGVLAEGWNSGWESWGGPSQIPFDYTKPYADFDIDEIMRYAKEKGVEFLGHHETGGDIINYEGQLDHAFQWTKAKGINHVKTGYAGGISNGNCHHNQRMVQHYRDVVKTAAKHHVTINAHEPIKDTGIRRTYPNMMSREGARGMEWNAWSEGNPPSHHEMLPFTRLLGGPMDYTPGTFDILLESSKNHPDRKKWNGNDKGNSRVNTTLAKQIANWVVIYSPVQMASDMIENYEGHPAFQFFRDFDADCDWSRALQGEPGEFIAIVRRAKDNFYLGATTNEQARTLTISLDFLEKGKQYEAVIYADGDDADWKTNPQSYRIEKKTVTNKDTLTICMAPGGGQAVSFIPGR